MLSSCCSKSKQNVYDPTRRISVTDTDENDPPNPSDNPQAGPATASAPHSPYNSAALRPPPTGDSSPSFFRNLASPSNLLRGASETIWGASEAVWGATTALANTVQEAAGPQYRKFKRMPSFPNHRVRIALVRHGESQNNAREASGSIATYWQGRDSDPALTERGHQQAQKLADYLQNEEKSWMLGIHPLTEIWCSPVKRAMQTIQPLSKTPVVRTNGPYYGKNRTTGDRIDGGHAKYLEPGGVSCYCNTTNTNNAGGEGGSPGGEGVAEVRRVLKPVVKTTAFEEGGMFSAEVEILKDYPPGSGKEAVYLRSKTAYPGLNRDQIQNDFGYDTSDPWGPPVTEKGWYTAEVGHERESNEEARARAWEFARKLKERAQKNYEESLEWQNNPVKRRNSGTDTGDIVIKTMSMKSEAVPPGASDAETVGDRTARTEGGGGKGGITPTVKTENVLLVAHYEFIAHLLNALIHYDRFPTRNEPDPNNPGKMNKVLIRPLPDESDDSQWSPGYWRSFNTAVSIVDVCGETGKVDVLRTNCVDHLLNDPELVSGFPLGYYEFK